MNSDIRTILEKILGLIAYHDDKNVFIKEFLTICLQKSLSDYVEMLPNERKKELQQILQEVDPTKLQERVEPYIATEEFSKLQQANMQQLLKDYFKTIRPTLTKEQTNNLESYFVSLQIQQPQNIP